MVRVYECRPSCDEDRPVIDFELRDNARNDWLAVAHVLDGTKPLESFPERVAIIVKHPDATDWDCYMDGGGGGLFSQRFVDIVTKDALATFSLPRASLNGQPYFFLRCEQTFDCFDRENAQVKVFPHNPNRIMRILHYAFTSHVPNGPVLFRIPESPQLLATEAIAERIGAGGLKGVRLTPVP